MKEATNLPGAIYFQEYWEGGPTPGPGQRWTRHPLELAGSSRSRALLHTKVSTSCRNQALIICLNRKPILLPCNEKNAGGVPKTCFPPGGPNGTLLERTEEWGDDKHRGKENKRDILGGAGFYTSGGNRMTLDHGPWKKGFGRHEQEDLRSTLLGG